MSRPNNAIKWVESPLPSRHNECAAEDEMPNAAYLRSVPKAASGQAESLSPHAPTMSDSNSATVRERKKSMCIQAKRMQK